MDFDQADALNQAIRQLSRRHRARAATLLAPLGLHPGQEVLLLELARTGPMIGAQLAESLGCEPPSVTLMTRKLQATGHIRRRPSPTDKRASIIELTDRGNALAGQVKQLWCALAEETVTGLPAQAVSELTRILSTLTGNVSPRHARTAGQDAPGASQRPVHVDQAMPLTRDYEPGVPGWVREHVEQIMRTGTTEGVTVKGRPTVLLTYRGAKTGRVRKVPVMRVEHEGRYAAVASKGGAPANPQWYTSLAAEPLIEIQDGTVTRQYRAREVFGDEKALWWRRAVEAYPDYAGYQRNIERQIPVFVLEPTSGADTGSSD